MPGGKKAQERPRILFSGGGTGGHVYPALAIIERLRQREPGVDVLYVGSRDGMEAELVTRAGVPFVGIRVRGLVRKRPLEVILGILALVRGLGQALMRILRFRPHVVVGTGGYVSGPVMAMAVLLRIPTLLQEQNVVPGVTNRWLSRFVERVALPNEAAAQYFPARARGWVTGNPVRPGLVAADGRRFRRETGLKPGEHLVLAFAGSRGSAVFTRLVLEWLPELVLQDGFRLLFIAGRAHIESFQRSYSRLGMDDAASGKLMVFPYRHDLPDVMAAADLLITRAGAMTLAEVAVLGRPAILIPSPHVTHHHQEANARAVAASGAALVLEEQGLTGARLHREVVRLLGDPERLNAMSVASRKLGRPLATDAIVDGIFELLHRRLHMG